MTIMSADFWEHDEEAPWVDPVMERRIEDGFKAIQDKFARTSARDQVEDILGVLQHVVSRLHKLPEIPPEIVTMIDDRVGEAMTQWVSMRRYHVNDPFDWPEGK